MTWSTAFPLKKCSFILRRTSPAKQVVSRVSPLLGRIPDGARNADQVRNHPHMVEDRSPTTLNASVFPTR
jgi:hypothetical protein